MEPIRQFVAKVSACLQKILIGLIHVYRYCLSPYIGHQCRFYPTCSKYAIEALERYGIMQGLLLIGKRLCKCHPWHAGGIDFIPEMKKEGILKCNQNTDD